MWEPLKGLVGVQRDLGLERQHSGRLPAPGRCWGSGQAVNFLVRADSPKGGRAYISASELSMALITIWGDYSRLQWTTVDYERSEGDYSRLQSTKGHVQG